MSASLILGLLLHAVLLVPFLVIVLFIRAEA